MRAVRCKRRGGEGEGDTRAQVGTLETSVLAESVDAVVVVSGGVDLGAFKVNWVEDMEGGEGIEAFTSPGICGGRFVERADDRPLTLFSEPAREKRSSEAMMSLYSSSSLLGVLVTLHGTAFLDVPTYLHGRHILAAFAVCGLNGDGGEGCALRESSGRRGTQCVPSEAGVGVRSQ